MDVPVILIHSAPEMRALYLILPILCILAIAYRYYSAFIAARIMALDDTRVTPAHGATTARTTTRPIAWCFSAIISPQSPGPDRSSVRCWPRSSAARRA